ncbi:hypothetical protein EPUS_00872 [Endocarpon pusillum Z07020]|uniref:Uncharacterized protein n=1 Tax=Endocarpon pusillum (strain Z07020 / HMAS-L-300199) TaxID=1263415 RepID=U1HW58_ENDPU|nr:uncharacterized protein EPUS_00872 [Endocarpon pusillum Z07020]ERF73619.1 hypothetical protein EPUS_00872 [Endocarpon pusillum Z07020]
MQPKRDLELLASPFCSLSRQQDFNIWLKFRLHHQQPITVTTTGSISDPAATFTKGRIEILDAETGEMHKHQPNISDGFAKRYPGKYPAQPDVPAQSDPIEVNLLGKNAPSFTTRPALPLPPPVTASLSTSTPTCSLTGNPPSPISLDWKLAPTTGPEPSARSNRENEATTSASRSATRRENGRRISPPSNQLSQEEDEDEEEKGDDPPDEEVLLRLRDGNPVRQSYTFTVNPKQNGLVNAETWNLVSGKDLRADAEEVPVGYGLYEDAVVLDEARLRARLGGETRVQFPVGRLGSSSALRRCVIAAVCYLLSALC